MSTNKISHGKRLDVVLAADAASGDVIVVGDLIGIAQVSGKSGDTVAIEREINAECPKATGQAWAVGNTLYWDATNKVLTTSSNTGANKRAAIASAVQASGDATGNAVLLPQVG